MSQTQTRKQKILGDVKKARRRRALISTLIVAVIAVGVVAGVILLAPHTPPDPHIGQPISPAMYGYLTGVSNATLAAVGSGSSQGVYPMTAITGSPLTSGGKPEFLYIGAEFCPYCAAERWGMIVALSKFGSFSGLTYMESSATDVNANTPTFSFAKATYTSQYVAFVSVEVDDRNHNPLQTLTSDNQNLWAQYASCNPQTTCGFAFIDIANQWVMGTPCQPGGTSCHEGSQFSPAILDGIGNWTQIGSQLNTPSVPAAQAVDGAANYMIKSICSVDGGQPSIVCNQSYLGGLTQAPIGVTNAPPANTFNMIVTSDSYSDESVWRNFP